jgi:hypothetical protein
MLTWLVTFILVGYFYSYVISDRVYKYYESYYES